METQRKDSGQNPSGTQQDILSTFAQKGTFKTFSSAVDKAGLNDMFAGPGPMTVFAPTDEAFAKLPAGRLDELFQPGNKEELAALVNYHVVKGRRNAVDVGKWEAARTVHGQNAPIQLSRGNLSIDGANVTSQDIESSNGMIHGIDKVNIPQARKN
ncbi:fasciclin domain-containing protein [Pseudoxanthomonas suwonensis]|uniref:Fasciclin n=1 Tax=Pseudoxanthomonas suwonensis TaxID=314722 RepID=A0A0E3ULV0_9GAMM|nr:fasciclin domain-containing protein [Pseudoxanthomonas suwonensis]AKC85796.1 fasciclin [Pseudoxanthomonas suwonensis]